jgi:magnesium-transporting ATPase (P-type)
MANVLLDRRHRREYILWGMLAGLAYTVPVLVYLSLANYYYSAVLFIGCILFMFVLLVYSMKLTKRRPEYKSTWSMIIAGHAVIAVGIIISVLISLILCFVYIPGFMSGDSDDSFLRRSPDGFNSNNMSTIMLIAMTSTLVNFGVGGFINILVSYAVKINQTKDKTPSILKDEPRHV